MDFLHCKRAYWAIGVSLVDHRLWEVSENHTTGAINQRWSHQLVCGVSTRQEKKKEKNWEEVEGIHINALDILEQPIKVACMAFLRKEPSLLLKQNIHVAYSFFRKTEENNSVCYSRAVTLTEWR